MKRVIIIICVLLSVIINAQEKPDPSSFFPSAVGNVWEYSTDHGFARQVIYSDSVDSDGTGFKKILDDSTARASDWSK